jgi:hypothetical protein
MMSAVATTADRQMRIVIAVWKGSRERRQPEEQNQEDGEPAPHLGLILHEKWNLRRNGAYRSGIIGALRFLIEG